MLSLVAFQCTVLCLWIWLHSITTRRSSARPTAMFWQRGPTRTISSMCFVSRRWIVCSLSFFLILSCHWLRDLGCVILEWCTMMIINDVDQKVVCWCDFAECVFNIIFLFTGNLCCELWVCWALWQCVLIVHLLCCMAMFVFDAISQAAASHCFKAWCCVWAWRNVTVCLCRAAVGQQYCHSLF